MVLHSLHSYLAVGVEGKCEVLNWFNNYMICFMSISCIITFQILSKGKWDKFLNEESSRLKTLGHGGEDYQKRMLELMKKEEERMRDNGYKYLSIANPTHGDEFFSLLFNKDWNDKSMIGIPRDKIYCLCSAKITRERLASFLKACAYGDLLVLTNFVFLN